ncbi:hypothetical protein [Microseira wollei]|uniref:Uncharacterized protein n=1 Tax=Microseira wollei NIES-4236 TaxID=2530354 RepID=A0AAV3XIN9_9CYAN|nr:hypothetical protein [Microseira wollei]GET42503.1 hypothetical protein MiSe_73210 [Microseira wollei NIES-4236]
MRKQYNKLVRDTADATLRERIPEIIQQNGLKYQVVTSAKSEYCQARQKLIEEAQEAAEANEELITELADLYYGINRELVLA